MAGITILGETILYPEFAADLVEGLLAGNILEAFGKPDINNNFIRKLSPGLIETYEQFVAQNPNIKSGTDAEKQELAAELSGRIVNYLEQGGAHYWNRLSSEVMSAVVLVAAYEDKVRDSVRGFDKWRELQRFELESGFTRSGPDMAMSERLQKYLQGKDITAIIGDPERRMKLEDALAKDIGKWQDRHPGRNLMDILTGEEQPQRSQSQLDAERTQGKSVSFQLNDNNRNAGLYAVHHVVKPPQPSVQNDAQLTKAPSPDLS